MPTTLPLRSRDSDFGRKRGLPRSAAALLLWAVTMFAVTAASHTAASHMDQAADVQSCDVPNCGLVLP